MFKYKGQKFLTDNDLEVTNLGKFPERIIQNKELRGIFKKEYGHDFLGGDEIISHRQALVAMGMDFNGLEEEFLKYIQNEDQNEKSHSIISKAVFDKTSTGIGRGHSMGGLSGVVLGLHGTKMIDSGLTGLVYSRSFVTSGRRRGIEEEDIVVPEGIVKREDLLQEYLDISRAAFKESAEFKEKFGKLGGIEAFNKALPYNNPADLFIVLPLDTMVTLASEVKLDESKPNGPFLPKEIHDLVKKFPEITKENGIGSMYKQRIQVPRDTYFHYNLFKDPNIPNYPGELAEKRGIPLKPQIIDLNLDLTKGFIENFYRISEGYKQTKKIIDPEELEEAAIRNMLATREFIGEYNEAIRVKIFDSLSFRVWSEQKRHATLRQNVESIYSAAKRASEKIEVLWTEIERAYNGEGFFNISELEKISVIDRRLKNDKKLLIPYAYHTGRQLKFFGKLIKEEIALRDAAYIIPRNIRTLNVEYYDLANLIDLELPLRLCKECEPERYETSWQKRNLIAEKVLILKPLLQPKCNVGYCTERNYCNHIKALRDYNDDLHKKTKEAMLKRAK
jgi:hypothetical protein